MTIQAGHTLEELNMLVHEALRALGLGAVRFAIRPLPFDFRNWEIDAQLPTTLGERERSALSALGHELRDKYYLLLANVPSPYAA